MRSLIVFFFVLGLAEAAPLDFVLSDLHGQEHRLADYRGRWVVANYWATWCAPCRKEIPDLSDLHEARDDLVVLGLAFEDTETAEIRRFLEQYPASYPILPVDVSAPPAAFGVPRGLPTTHLLDPAGRLVKTWVGPVTSALITDWIDGHD